MSAATLYDTMVKWHFHLSRGSCLQARSILLCQLVLRDLEPFLYFSVVGFGRLGSFLPSASQASSEFRVSGWMAWHFFLFLLAAAAVADSLDKFAQ